MISDPSGWTVENNPHPPNNTVIMYARMYNKRKSDTELDVYYFEYDTDGWHTLICHSCLLRAKYDSGNCMDGGDYFQCLKMPEKVKEREEIRQKYYKTVKKTVQSKLW